MNVCLWAKNGNHQVHQQCTDKNKSVSFFSYKLASTFKRAITKTTHLQSRTDFENWKQSKANGKRKKRRFFTAISMRSINVIVIVSIFQYALNCCTKAKCIVHKRNVELILAHIVASTLGRTIANGDGINLSVAANVLLPLFDHKH